MEAFYFFLGAAFAVLFLMILMRLDGITILDAFRELFRGPQGLPGPEGLRGEQGPPGKDGERGPPGYSAAG